MNNTLFPSGRRRALRVGMFVWMALTLTSCTSAGPEASTTGTLASCSIDDSPFHDLPLHEWPTVYHETVSAVIEAHLAAMQTLPTQKLDCSATQYPAVFHPTDALRALAATLDPWSKEGRLDTLSESEIGPILLEYVRTYECALAHKRQVLLLESGSGVLEADRPSLGTDSAVADDEKLTQEELAIARPALERTLGIVGGLDRLNPLRIEVECLKRISLDLRNDTGLLSQATACMPRVRDARTSFRDLP